MKKIFYPAIVLLNRLKYPKKFALIGLFILIPVIITMYQLINQLNTSIEFAQQEKIGVEYLQPVKKLLQDVQQHRGMASAYLNGDQSFKDKMEKKQTDITTDLETLAKLDTTYGQTLKTSDKLTSINKQWSSIQGNINNLKAKESFATHTKLVAEIINFMTDVADSSNLTLDPDLDTFYMMDAVVSKLPNWSENLGQSRALGTSVAVKKSLSIEEKAQLIILTSQIKANLEATTRGIQVAFDYNPALKEQLSSSVESNVTKTNEFLTIMDKELINASSINIPSKEYFNQATLTIDTLFKTFDQELVALDQGLDNRIDKFSTDKAWIIAISLSGFLITLYLMTAFYYAIIESIGKIQTVSTQLAQGDLTATADLSSKDEMLYIASSFNDVAASLRSIIANNKQVSEQLALSSDTLYSSVEETNQTNSQIGEMIHKMAQGSTYQLKGSEESTTAMTEMAQGIQRIAEASSQVSESSNKASDEAELGNESINKSIQQMQSINKSVNDLAQVLKQLDNRSQEIGNIIEIISNIASQTNLLALNAAIEAARAGEQGRGFAVVAEEVRKLAEQSAQSSNQIGQLIQVIQQDTNFSAKAMENVLKEVELGQEISNVAGQNFQQIYEASRVVADQIMDITASSQEMSACSQEILASLESMNKISHDLAASSQNIASSSDVQAAAMEEVAASADSLKTIAQELLNTTNRFKV